MSNAFVVYVRNEEQVLVMKRADSVSEFPLAWDGIFGVGDANDLDVVFQRIKEATGIESDKITHIRTGEPRGLAFGNTNVMSYKGYFRPSNKHKYKGDHTNVIYRS